MDAYIASIWSFGFSFAPRGYMMCNGQLLAISGNEALFALIGTTYGGDGITTFALPNMQGRRPIGTGTGPGLPSYVIGQMAGTESVTLITNNMPAHTHAVLTATVPVNATVGDQADPTTKVFGAGAGTGNIYNSTGGVTMAANNGTTGIAGSNIPLDILNPYLTINYCICVEGIFPSRN